MEQLNGLNGDEWFEAVDRLLEQAYRDLEYEDEKQRRLECHDAPLPKLEVEDE